MSKLILVGSNYFFKDYEDFKSKDKDYLMLVDEPKGFKFVRQTSSSHCLFEWKKMTPEEFIDYTLTKGPAMQIGKFLVPEFNEKIGFTIDHLKQLETIFNNLDEKHKYEKIIYQAYITNNDFTLTEEQRNLAYQSYKEARSNKEEE